MRSDTLERLGVHWQATERLFLAGVITLMFAISGLTLAYTNPAASDLHADAAAALGSD